MTAIAVYTNGTVAAIGLDSGSTAGPGIVMTDLAKVLRTVDITSPKGKPRGRLVMAACGRHRIGNEIVNRWTAPPRRNSVDVPAYMLDVADSLQAHLAHPDSPSQRHVRDAGDNDLDGWFLAICDGRVFAIGCDFSVSEPACGYYAAGSAQGVVLGALAALAPSDLDPEAIVLRSLEIARDHVESIVPPFHVATA